MESTIKCAPGSQKARQTAIVSAAIRIEPWFRRCNSGEVKNSIMTSNDISINFFEAPNVTAVSLLASLDL
jgi:hypothetical protein